MAPHTVAEDVVPAEDVVDRLIALCDGERYRRPTRSSNII
jgi:hypothetical protein